MYPQTIAPDITDHDPEENIQLLDYWRTIVLRRWTIFAVLSTVVTLTVIYTLKQTPIYSATASVQIDKENPNVLSFKGVYDIETESDDTLRTQYEILKSRRLARRVIEDLKLDRTEEFQPSEPSILSSALSSVRSFLSPKPKVESKEPDMLRPVVTAYLRRLFVEPVRQARLVNIRFESKDPELAARIINAHAQQFIQQNLQFKVEATEQASTFLEENLVTLKAKLENAEDQLQQYGQRNQILFTEEGKNTASEKLRQLQEAFTKTQEDRIHKESYYRLIDGGYAEALPQVIENKLISDLTAKLADLQRQDSELAVTFQPEYPLRQRLTGQITQIKVSIDTEKARIVSMVRSEYSAAADREQLLGAELAKQRDIVEKINEDIIQYNIYKGDADSVKQLYEGLQKRLKEASVSAGLTASNLRIVDRAEVPINPVRPRMVLNLVLGLMAGLVCGVGLAFLQEYVDSSIKSPEDIARYLNLATLGMIPKLDSARKGYRYGGHGYGYGHNKPAPLSEANGGELHSDNVLPTVDLIVHESPSSLLAEAYRSVRTSLLLSSSGHPPRTILVTSAVPSEGKTTTAVNLAISLTQTGSKVVLIDADMRKPRVQRVFGLNSAVGLSSFLAGTAKLKEIIQETTVPGLMVIPCGVPPPNPGELILSPGFRRMLEALREYFDCIVLDSPPLCNVSDARILAVIADSTIVVVKAFSTSRHYIRDAVTNLTNARARVGGVVLNDVDVRRRSYYSRHSYYRSYYSSYGAYGHYGAEKK